MNNYITELTPIAVHLASKTAAIENLRILCLGDVFGRAGRDALKEHLPRLKKELGIHFTMVNGENSSSGSCITTKSAAELLNAGADVITGGNHTLHSKEIFPFLESNHKLLRPANLAPSVPGKGMGLYKASDGTPVFVLNLIGRVFMNPHDCPFRAANAALQDNSLSYEAPEKQFSANSTLPPIRLVDFHAETTSEKRALAYYLDGRVSAVLGTHTHVQTTDTSISAAGTAYITDLGMCGVEEDSILGVAKEPVLKRFVQGMPSSFKPAKGVATIHGVLLDVDRQSGQAKNIRLVKGKDSFVLI